MFSDVQVEIFQDQHKPFSKFQKYVAVETLIKLYYKFCSQTCGSLFFLSCIIEGSPLNSSARSAFLLLHIFEKSRASFHKHVPLRGKQQYQCSAAFCINDTFCNNECSIL